MTVIGLVSTSAAGYAFVNYNQYQAYSALGSSIITHCLQQIHTVPVNV